MAVGEFELIRRYFHYQAGAYGVALGIGDDCALLQPPANKQLAVSMDTLVGGIHFPNNADPELIAQRALRVNLSDLAAMGAEPLWFTLGLTLPNADAKWLEGFSRGLFSVANEYNCALVGGDTTRGPLCITIQVHGAVEAEEALLRGNASMGDQVYVTGCLGDAAAALAVIKGEMAVGKSAFNYFMACYYRPVPRLRESVCLRGLASSCIDVSDGLLADLGHICENSVVGAVVDLERVPLSEPVRKLVEPDKAIKWALSGGDDYQLCFTVPPERLGQLRALIDRGTLQATAIGEIVAGDKVTCVRGNRIVEMPKSGYQHFENNSD